MNFSKGVVSNAEFESFIMTDVIDVECSAYNLKAAKRRHVRSFLIGALIDTLFQSIAYYSTTLRTVEQETIIVRHFIMRRAGLQAPNVTGPERWFVCREQDEHFYSSPL